MRSKVPKGKRGVLIETVQHNLARENLTQISCAKSAMQWLTCCGLLIGAGSGLKDNVRIMEELMLFSDGHDIPETCDTFTSAADR